MEVSLVSLISPAFYEPDAASSNWRSEMLTFARSTWLGIGDLLVLT